jgi:hypothetical protein
MATDWVKSFRCTRNDKTASGAVSPPVMLYGTHVARSPQVAVYSTFFVADSDALLSGFPGWKLPLDKSIQREITDFFGEKRTIETREPLWEDVVPSQDPVPDYGVVAIEGDYAAYLEARLPAFVRKAPHWCSKGLTNVELDPLGELTDGKPALEEALFAHPSCCGHLLVFRQLIVESILKAPQQLAQKWAARMSTPEYTHSAERSNRLQDDWSVDDALRILGPLGQLVKKASPGQRLYLLLEW